ncbi:MAG: hypothetical protein IPK79_10420 [Vampirovibrionales bacterium]|nr:hypothetical protein [Vampirovibrionales bacterium]
MTEKRARRARAFNAPINAPVALDTAILDTFRLVAQTQQEVRRVAARAREAITSRYRDPQALAAFIEAHGTPVYTLPGGLRGLIVLIAIRALGYDAGFIPPPASDGDTPPPAKTIKRYRALCGVLTSLLGVRPGVDFTHGAFALPNALFTVGFMAHQLHHWLSFLAGLPGYDAQEQETFRAFMGEHQGVVNEKVLQMSPARLAGLRRAIHREIEALQFLKNLTDELFRPTNQAQRILNGTLGA